ncbi:MAG: low molecular weight protein-tyrosine-phosphatase [Bacteroidota bacterium]
MVKILMVCLGNICRSPLAEGILKSKVNNNEILVDSAGTASYHVGELPDERSIQVAQINNIDLTNQRCRQITISDFDEFDHIYVMDSSNFNDVLSLARNEQDKQKVRRILDLIHPDKNLDVPDPYYGGERGFDRVFNLLDKACDEIVKNL